MRLWRFLNYCSEAGNNLIERWYRNQDAEVQAVFDITLNNLAGLENWRDTPEFKSLKGKHSGLGEIRFKVKNVQYRPAGMFGPAERTFTILVGCCKKMGVYDPPNAFDLALRNKSLIRQREDRQLSILMKLRERLERGGTEYRSAFVAAQLKRGIPFQARALRKQRGWSQEQLAEACNLTQGAVSRALDPDYGNLTLNTILKLAAGFDVAFVGKFVPFSELAKWFNTQSEQAIQVPSFSEDSGFIDKKEMASATASTADFISVTNFMITGMPVQPSRVMGLHYALRPTMLRVKPLYERESTPVTTLYKPELTTGQFKEERNAW